MLAALMAPFATTHASFRQEVERIVSNLMAQFGGRIIIGPAFNRRWAERNRWNSPVRILPPQLMNK
jgi:hypothetical protein